MGPRRVVDPRPGRCVDRRRPGARRPPAPAPPLIRDVGGRPVGVELAEEEGAALGFVVLTDGGRRAAKAVERAEEAAVGLVAPADVARPPPARLPQAVEAAVIPDTEAGVGLDVVTRQLTEARPGVQRAGPAGHDGSRLVA